MNSSPTSVLFLPTLDHLKRVDANGGGCMVFDSSHLCKQARIPSQFIWPRNDRLTAIDELEAPIIDLQGFLHGDEASTLEAAKLVASACTRHGFFQVTNHGVDTSLIREAFACMDEFFLLPLNEKLRARRKPGSMWGYAGAHTDRFSSKLPWKETLSFGFNDTAGDKAVVADYIKSQLGNEFEQMGLIYQKYCEAMRKLSEAIVDLLAISMGVNQSYFRDFFDESSSIMRCNYYPSCQEPELALGTGPHTDPTSLTILQQDQVGGLEVFTEGEWKMISPVREALVINIGDTFMALSNGMYKSCLHRAVVNSRRERRSLAFFLCPRSDKMVRPPVELCKTDRQYPNFTWAQLLQFTQQHYRADVKTLQAFTQWLGS
uniref:Gibberellin 20-oxidase n=1 Tax=Fritillaria thunbergii TaxID=108546 RepID=A0A8K1BLI3_9LILI|nr:gibberellin 20-oxidase [Fritillaria thunbergii]